MTDSEIIKLLKKDAEQGLAELMQSYTGFVCSVIKGASPLFSAEDIEELAGHLFISESYLFRLFKNELHQTPKQYICEKRLLLAQNMLNERQKPTKVALACGFSDYSTFYRNYTAFFGTSPNEITKKG